MAEYATTAVAFDDLKNAALYFDHLVPVYLAVDIFTDRSEYESLVGRQHGLIPPELLNRPGFKERFVAVNQATTNLFCKLAIQQFGLQPKIGGVSEQQYASIEESAVSEYFRFIEDHDLKECPLASAGGSTSAWMGDDDEGQPSPVVTIADLKMVNVSAVSWEHILEFREDQESRDRLRRLRLFAYEKYSGQSRAYIEDDLLTRISDYEQTARQWGFETFLGSISSVLNSKLTASIVAGSFLTTLFGQPRTALLSAGIAAVVEVGHVSIEISRQRFAIQKLARDSAVSFVSYSREKLDL